MKKKLSKIIRITRNNKTILKWKVNFRAKCMTNKNLRMKKTVNKQIRFLISRWVKSTTIKDNKISRTNKGKPKGKAKLISMSKDSNKANNNLSITNGNKTNKKEKANKIDKIVKIRNKNNKKEVTGKTMNSKDKKLISKNKTSKNTKKALMTCRMKSRQRKYQVNKTKGIHRKKTNNNKAK